MLLNSGGPCSALYSDPLPAIGAPVLDITKE